MISVTIKGEKKLIDKLKKFGDQGKDIISEQVQQTASNIAVDAKNNARNNGVFDLGNLVQGIVYLPLDDLNAEVRAKEKYSAYHEFGTGGKISIPPDWTEVAAQFKGKGIKEVNIRPRPFMYPAFIKNRALYFKGMKKALKELTNKMK